MTTAAALVLVAVMCLLCAALTVLLVRGAKDPLPPAPEPVAPRPVKPVRTVLIRFVDTHGQTLGSQTIDRDRRPHQMIYRHDKQRRAGVFVASHMDKGVWVYRRVGDD